MSAQVGASGPLDAGRVSAFLEEVESSDSGFRTEAEMADARAAAFCRGCWRLSPEGRAAAYLKLVAAERRATAAVGAEVDQCSTRVEETPWDLGQQAAVAGLLRARAAAAC